MKNYKIFIILVILSILGYQYYSITKKEAKETKLYNSKSQIQKQYTTPLMYRNVITGNTEIKMKLVDGKLVPITILTPEQMKIQMEQGCSACHDKF